MCGFVLEMKGSKPTEEESNLHEKMIARYLGWEDWRNMVGEGCVVLSRIRADIKQKPKEFWEQDDPWYVLILTPDYKEEKSTTREKLIRYLKENVPDIFIEERGYCSLYAKHIAQNQHKDRKRDVVYVIRVFGKLSVMSPEELQKLFYGFIDLHVSQG